MFESLMQIDWIKLRHIAGDSKFIPQSIHNMLSPDEGTRENAISFLLGEGQHLGMIAETTIHIIPFVLEVLALDNYEEKNFLLYGLCMNISWILQNEENILQMRKHLAVYDEILKGLDLYIALLKHSEKEVRIQTCALLARLQTEAIHVLAILKQQYEQDLLEVRLAIIENMIHIPNLFYEPDYKVYREFILAILKDSKDLEERLAAAKLILKSKPYIAVELNSPEPALSNALFEAFFNETVIYKKYDIARYISHIGYKTIAKHLEESALQAEDAHLLIRALLCSSYVVTPAYSKHWNNRPQKFWEDILDNPIFYYPFDLNYLGHKKDPQVLAAILSCDAFWEIPSNLLSIFYDLPNDKDELRKLIHS